MSSTDEFDNLRRDVYYLRYLLEAGLERDEIAQIAEQTNPSLEVCFEENECMLKAKTLEHGKHIVMLS